MLWRKQSREAGGECEEGELKFYTWWSEKPLPQRWPSCDRLKLMRGWLRGHPCRQRRQRGRRPRGWAERTRGAGMVGRPGPACRALQGHFSVSAKDQQAHINQHIRSLCHRTLFQFPCKRTGFQQAVPAADGAEGALAESPAPNRFSSRDPRLLLTLLTGQAAHITGGPGV